MSCSKSAVKARTRARAKLAGERNNVKRIAEAVERKAAPPPSVESREEANRRRRQELAEEKAEKYRTKLEKTVARHEIERQMEQRRMNLVDEVRRRPTKDMVNARRETVRKQPLAINERRAEEKLQENDLQRWYGASALDTNARDDHLVVTDSIPVHPPRLMATRSVASFLPPVDVDLRLVSDAPPPSTLRPRRAPSLLARMGAEKQTAANSTVALQELRRVRSETALTEAVLHRSAAERAADILGAMGLKWIRTQAPEGNHKNKFENPKLSEALMGGRLEFERSDLDSFGVFGLRWDSCVQAGGSWFKPDPGALVDTTSTPAAPKAGRRATGMVFTLA